MTQPNRISKAMGDPGDPNCRPWSTTSTKTSTQKSSSIRPGSPKLGSTSCRPRSKWEVVHKWLEGLWWLKCGSSWLKNEMSTYGMTWQADWNHIQNQQHQTPCDLLKRGRCRPWAYRSELKGSDEPESRIVLASIMEPSGASTSTRQVISNKSDLILVVACEALIGSAVWVGEFAPIGDTTPACIFSSIWRRVWWVFFYRLYSDEAICSFSQSALVTCNSWTVHNISMLTSFYYDWEISTLDTYTVEWVFSGLHITLLLEVSVLTVNDVTGLADTRVSRVTSYQNSITFRCQCPEITEL